MVVKEERKLSELLTILLNSRDVFFSGLCGIILTLVGRNKISYYESVELRRFITENRPIKKMV